MSQPKASRHNFGIPYRAHQKEPTKYMRASQPMQARSGDHRRREQRSQQEISTNGEGQPATQPRTRGDRERDERCYAAQPIHAMRPAQENVRSPLPSNPRLAGFREGKWIGAGKSVMLENPFTAPDVPARVGVAKELFPGAKHKQAVSQRRHGQQGGKVGQQQLRQYSDRRVRW